MMKQLTEFPPNTFQRSCVACGSQSPRRTWFDTGSFVESPVNGGRVVICHLCILEGGHELGMMPESEHETVKKHSREYLKRVEEQNDRIADLTKQLDWESSERLLRENQHQTALEKIRVQHESTK